MDQLQTVSSETVNLTEQRRLALHQEFVAILGNAKHVYFMPPNGTLMCYPAIVYYVGGGNDAHADNTRYIPRTTFDVTLIESDPLSSRVDAIRGLRYASYVTSFKKDGFHQHKFKIIR